MATSLEHQRSKQPNRLATNDELNAPQIDVGRRGTPPPGARPPGAR